MNDVVLNCPWSDFTRGNFPLCEEALCAWVKQPANAYSNFLFLGVSFYLIYLYFKGKSFHGLGLGLCILFIGCASFIAHSSGTKLFGFFDFAAIFTAFSYYAATNTLALAPDKFRNRFKIFCGYLLISIGFLLTFNFLREILFGGFVVGLIFSEHKILKSQGKSFFISSNKKVIFTFLVGTLFLVLDAKKIICDPTNHFFQMHALWHICDALSLFFLARHLDQHRSV